MFSYKFDFEHCLLDSPEFKQYKRSYDRSTEAKSKEKLTFHTNIQSEKREYNTLF